MQIGPYKLKNNIILAPMAGITDGPFRRLCRETGAGLAVSEMVSSSFLLWNTRKTRQRLELASERSPITVQIVGASPGLLAEAARFNVDNGAEIIDINMGCPARNVCKAMAGAALLKDELLVGRILRSVVTAVDVPVTLKIRTGWDSKNRNANRIACIAEESGIQAITIHGRTRACGFKGQAEHRTAADIKSRVSIPVIANGDIRTPQQVAKVLRETGVDGIMIGRASLGNPWIFREINHYLETGRLLPPPNPVEIEEMLLRHVSGLYYLYGDYTGVRVARKHIGWYMKNRFKTEAFMALLNKVESTTTQVRLIRNFFTDQQELAA